MFQTCILLTLLAVVRGDYSPPPSGPGYTTPTVNPSTPTLLHNPTATYPAPTAPGPYTTAVVQAVPSTPTIPSVTTMPTPSSVTLYPSVGQTNIRANNGYSYPAPSYSIRESYSPFFQQLTPQFISQYYKQPTFVNPYSQQPPAPSHTLNPPSFQPHSCTSPNNPSFYPQQPYFQSALYQVPNPLSFLNGLASPNSFHAMVNPPGPRGPLPSPGYYSPLHPTSQPLFSVGYSSPVNRPLPYSVH